MLIFAFTVITLFLPQLTLEDEGTTTTSPCPDGWIDGSFVDMGSEQQYWGVYIHCDDDMTVEVASCLTTPR